MEAELLLLLLFLRYMLLLLLLLRYIDISIQLGALISSRFEKYIIYLLQLIVRDISVYYFVV